MIERLNFYDVYGYLLPGAIIIALLWLPHAIATGTKPPTDLTGAVIALIAAYVVGHVLQLVAGAAIPSEDDRYPSDQMLDMEDSSLASEVKMGLSRLIRERFGVDVSDEPAATRRTRRDSGFRLCRSALITARAGSYAEQFQGMYVFMRGICASAAIGCLYAAGWVNGAMIDRLGRWAPVALVVIAPRLALAFGRRLSSRSRGRRIELIIWLLLAAFAIGAFTGRGYSFSVPLVSLVAVGTLLAAMWTYSAYKYFAVAFAKTVYLDYYVHARQPPSKST